MKNIIKIILYIKHPYSIYEKLAKIYESKKISFWEFWDFRKYRRLYTKILEIRTATTKDEAPLLFVFGRGMNLTWAQIWIYLCLDVIRSGTKIEFLIYPTRKVIYSYLDIVKPKYTKFSDLRKLGKGVRIQAFPEQKYEYWAIRRYYYENLPVGQIILSTFARYNFSGEIDITDSKFQVFFKEWEPLLIETYNGAMKYFSQNTYSAIIFTETFCEDYGPVYFAALKCGLDIIKTSGTVRDTSILVQRRNRSNARLSHATLSASSLEIIKRRISPSIAIEEVKKNFADRYGKKWHRSMRNNNNSRNMQRDNARAELGIPYDQKVGIIFSHILYDALLHYGEELYSDYAEWLVRTVELAVGNDKCMWFIKYHPSNIWRGELNSMLGGKYEEDRIIDKRIPCLPPHVKKIYPDTDMSAWTWMNLADIGVCVRGTPGLEMACLGKPVITAGTGRYEGHGFTHDPQTIVEYEAMISKAHEFGPLSEAETNSANIFAHGLFNLKPFPLNGLIPEIASGKKVVSQSDDINYLPDPKFRNSLLDASKRFSDFIFQLKYEELLSDLER